MVFDAETTTDPAQNLRFGSYYVHPRHGLDKPEKGLFYNPDILKPHEQVTLKRYAKRHGLIVRTHINFIEEVFFGIGYDQRASIIGFNLPFDISRLSHEHASARTSEARHDMFMRGGFTFKLSRNWWRPRVQIKHHSQSLAGIRFAAPPDPHASGSALKKKNRRGSVRRGFFMDLKTIAAALTSQNHSLDSLGKFLKVSKRKIGTAEHGKPLTNSYIEYAVRDVETSWDCFVALQQRYDAHKLTKTQLDKIYSEASLGKAYLREMGIAPWQEVQPDFPSNVIGFIMSTYYGGRAEVHIRREIAQVFYSDFRSMYPSVCTLMRLWDFVIAKEMTHRDTTTDTRRFLKTVTLDDLQSPKFWQNLHTIVQLQPDADALPVRAKYDKSQYNIGVNYLTSKEPMWYTLADCIASKLLTGKPPKILKAYSFVPGRRQTRLWPINIMGDPRYRIDPAKDDFYRRLIDLRREVQDSIPHASKTEAARLDAEQLAIKILANATSYGIFVELNVQEFSDKRTLLRYGAKGKPDPVRSKKEEETGAYFHPLLGTLITGAARLMLAITETLAKKAELDWAFCDTDSMALAKPATMTEAEFYRRAKKLCGWFTPLNPYTLPGPLLQVEDENRSIVNGKPRGNLETLFCYAISAKRYVLFNKGRHGRPVIRKCLAHGLGHLYRPYVDDAAPSSFPSPQLPLEDLEVRRWQHDLWYRIVIAALAQRETNTNPADHVAFDIPAASRYHAATPKLLSWFKSYNARTPAAQRVRPFNFLIPFQARTDELWDTGQAVLEKSERIRTRTPKFPKPVAPYDDDIRKAARRCFDRETGRPVPIRYLKTYLETLAQYHLHAEAKFLNGRRRDHGPTRRRHVNISVRDIHYIGKEASELEEQIFLGADDEAMPEYGMERQGYELLSREVWQDLQGYKPQDVSRATGISLRYVRMIRDGFGRVRVEVLERIEDAIATLRDEGGRNVSLIQWAREYDEVSRREFAQRLGVDRRNLDKALSGKRKPTRELLRRLHAYAARQHKTFRTTPTMAADVSN